MPNTFKKAVLLIWLCLVLPALGLPFLPEAGAAPFSNPPRRGVIAGPIAGEIVDILDCDTVSVRVHVWIGQIVETHVRIDGIDTPEMKGKCERERDMAASARAEIRNLVGKDGKIMLSNIKLEKYAGRVLATAKTMNGTDIASHMIDKGYARPMAAKNAPAGAVFRPANKA